MKLFTSAQYQRVTNGFFAFVLAISSLTAIGPFLFSQNASALAAPGTYVVTGNTSAAENAEGWMFGRNPGFQTPFEFSGTDSSTGTGSIYVAPISAAPASNKFIAENFVLSEIADIQSISYDYKLGPATNANQIYMNVYMNFPESDMTKFYDCRYDVVQTSGSTAAFSTATFDLVNGTYSVVRSGTSPQASCPATPAAMGSNAKMRAFVLNVGDTSASDAGMSAYIDNVRVVTTTGTVVYDFEPVPTATPANLRLNGNQPCGFYTNVNSITPTWDSVPGAASYTYTVTLPNGGVYGPVNVGNVTSLTGPFGAECTSTFSVQAVGTNGTVSAFAPACAVTYDTVAPVAPMLSSPVNNAIVNGASVTQSWTTSDSDVDYYVYESYNDAAATSLRWSEQFTATSKTATNVANAEYWWRVKAVDYAGNESAWSDIWKITIDNDAPIATITVPADSDVLSGTVDIRGSVIDDNLWRYHFVIKNSANATVFQKTVTTPEFTDELLHSWDTTAVADGEYTIFISSRDLADNKDGDQTTDGVSTDTITVTVDNTAPLISLDAVESTINGITTFSGTASDATSGLLNDQIRLVFRPIIGGVLQSPERVYHVAVDGSGNWTIDVNTGTDLTDGQLYRVVARANDSVGGTYATSNTSTDRADTTVDNTAPVVTMNAIAPVVVGNDAVFGGTMDDPTATLTFTLDGTEYPTTNDGSTWQAVVSTTGFDARDYVATIVAEDSVGNVSAADTTTTTTLTVEEPASAPEEVQGTDTTPTPLAVVTPLITTPPATPAVLGDTTADPAAQSGEADVEGANIVAQAAETDTDTNDGSLFGLAWYWWVLIVAAIAAFIAWLIAALRRRNSEA